MFPLLSGVCFAHVFNALPVKSLNSKWFTAILVCAPFASSWTKLLATNASLQKGTGIKRNIFKLTK